MKTVIITFMMGLLSLSAFAQQDAGFSMYFFNPVYINPAYAGSRELISGSLVNRNQWVGMSGAPNSQSLTLHSAIPNSRVGLGLQVYNDKAGPIKNTGLSFTYAYHIPLNETTKLSFGLSGMLNNIRVSWDDINVDNPNDPSFTGNTASAWVPDAAAGVYLYKSRFYAGLSASHLFQSKFNMTSTSSADQAKFFRQYYLTSGVVIPINKVVDFRPSVLLKYVGAAPLVVDVNGSFIFFQRLFVGVGYRVGKKVNISGADNMVIGILQLSITDYLSVGYAYDYYLNRTGAYNSGTHEIMLGWDISHTKTKMSNPRFF
jgi:type IX secretion system PorP/SprF family membrane protein